MSVKLGLVHIHQRFPNSGTRLPLAGVGILVGNQVDCMKDVLIFNKSCCKMKYILVG
jgi:hypothetical protein